MSEKGKSVRAVRDVQGVPPEAYRLPADGRKWFQKCVQSQRFAWLLATYADGGLIQCC